MATIPVQNPTVPFLGRIPNGLHHGVMLRIKGHFLPIGQRFSINLQCGPALNPSDDIALHLSVRPNEQTIVRNSFERYTWGSEQRYGGCPIYLNQNYEILILSEISQYKIAINGVHFCEFSHRLPLSKVNFIYISGDTAVTYIGVEGDHTTPTAPPSIGFNPTAPPYMAICPPHPSAINQFPTMPPGYNTMQPPKYMEKTVLPDYNPQAALSYPVPPYPSNHKKQNFLEAAKGAVSTVLGTGMLFGNKLQQKLSNQTPNPYPYNSSSFGQGAYPGVPNPTIPHQQPQQSYMPGSNFVPAKKKNNKVLKYAAAAGGVGLGAYALSRVLHSSSSSDSD